MHSKIDLEEIKRIKEEYGGDEPTLYEKLNPFYRRIRFSLSPPQNQVLSVFAEACTPLYLKEIAKYGKKSTLSTTYQLCHLFKKEILVREGGKSNFKYSVRDESFFKWLVFKSNSFSSLEEKVKNQPDAVTQHIKKMNS